MKIIDIVADWLVLFNKRMHKADDDFAAFLKRGNNGFIVASIFLGSIFLLLSHSLYESYGILWLASAPILMLVLALFVIRVNNSYRRKLKKQNGSSRMRLVGFHVDFNERFLRKIYTSLTKYEYLDENLTSFQDFYNVLVLDFEEHDSALYFICTNPN